MKHPILKIISIFLLFFLGILFGIGGLWFAIQNNIELRYYLFEQATASLPQSKISAFVHSIVQQDRATALKLWEIYDDPISKQQNPLAQRRNKVISDLFSAQIQSDYLVMDIEWWSTCCEPNVINDSRNAGGARITVQFTDKNGFPMLYKFDIFTREQPYWGSAAGYPPRDWIIRDVYPYDENPMYWLLLFEPQIRTIHLPEP